jgi:hypothetical protein
MMDNPPRRLIRMIMNLRQAREEAEALLMLTQETNNLNLQKEGAWFIHQINQLIVRGADIVPRAGSRGKGKMPCLKRIVKK